MNDFNRKNGSASALIILVLTVLVLLGVLSLVTVAADRRLADKRAEWQKDYYLLDSDAVRLHASLSEAFKEYAAAMSSQELFSEDLSVWAIEWLNQSGVNEAHAELSDRDLQVSFVVGDTDSDEPVQLIEIKLMLETSSSGNPQTTILKWQQRQSERPQIDETGVIWIPE